MSETDQREVKIGEGLTADTTAQILAICENKLATRRRLAHIDPTNPQWRCDEAGILTTIGIESRNAGLSVQAICAFEESCIILRELADRDPRNSNLHRHLSIGLAELAKARLDVGDLEGALADQEECLLINRKLRKRASSLAQQLAAAEKCFTALTALWETIRPAESLRNRPVTMSVSPAEVRHSFEGYLKIDRGAQPPHCGVGYCSFTGWFRYAPAGLPDILKIWLQAPACPKLRCVANFEQRLKAAGTG